MTAADKVVIPAPNDNQGVLFRWDDVRHVRSLEEALSQEAQGQA